jgi:hypothetical protein
LAGRVRQTLVIGSKGEAVMTNDLKARAPRDLNRIGMDEAWEIQWWTVKFAVTEDELRKAVAAVGPTPAEVERHLKEAARKSFKKMGED